MVLISALLFMKGVIGCDSVSGGSANYKCEGAFVQGEFGPVLVLFFILTKMYTV